MGGTDVCYAEIAGIRQGAIAILDDYGADGQIGLESTVQERVTSSRKGHFRDDSMNTCEIRTV